MKRRLLKYFIVFFIFFIGISLGNIKTDEAKEVMYPVEKVEENFFMRLGHDGEQLFNKGFKAVFDVTGGVLKTVFGL